MSATGYTKGRGAASNPANRFLQRSHEAFDDGWADGESPPDRPRTTLQPDSSRSVLVYNRSPDVPFDRSVNPYRGCEHGCIYCYARPTHAYLDCSPGLDFETRLFYKPAAAALLRSELGRPGYRCQPIALGVNTDAYQPVERELKITRGILEVLAGCGHPVGIVTKSALIERDLDLLHRLAEQRLVHVTVSVTTLDRALARVMEPRAAAPHRRLQTIRALHEAGIPVGVLVAPVIPALNDAEMERILEATKEAGAVSAGYVMLRLPHEVKDLFKEWLALHLPLRAERVMNRIRDIREGRENDSRFGARMRGSGVFAELIRRRFETAACRLGFADFPAYDLGRFRPPRDSGGQMELFD
ncbi:MAG: PA0069 family radical SAM protein [Gammaproteobacteria bacterium]|jgi:DNA repair photolyase